MDRSLRCYILKLCNCNIVKASHCGLGTDPFRLETNNILRPYFKLYNCNIIKASQDTWCGLGTDPFSLMTTFAAG